MSEIYFISDTHFGHKKILEFEPSRRTLGDTIEEHNEKLIDNWNSVVSKNDIVWHLGDVAWSSTALKLCERLRGDKRLVMGNHDHYGSDDYLRYFTKLYGVATLKTGEVLSHIPLHPDCAERWKVNIHGHLHSKLIKKSSVLIEDLHFYDSVVVDKLKDKKYVNVSCERINFTPISYEQLKERIFV